MKLCILLRVKMNLNAWSYWYLSEINIYSWVLLPFYWLMLIIPDAIMLPLSNDTTCPNIGLSSVLSVSVCVDGIGGKPGGCNR